MKIKFHISITKSKQPNLPFTSIYDLSQIYHKFINRMPFFAPNLPKPTPSENKIFSSIQNTLRLLKNILTLTKKIFML